MQFIEKLGIGDGCTIGVFDEGIAFGGEASYSEGHGDTVIAARFDFRAVDFAGVAAFDAQAIGEFFHFRAHFAEVFSEGGYAVTFLDAQFGGVANFDSLFSERTKSGEHGEFVNQKGNEFTGNAATSERCAFDDQVADEFALRALQVQNRERRAQGLEEIENGRARGIQADIGDEEIGLGQQGCGRDEENGGRKIAGDIEGFGLQGNFASAIGQTLNRNGAAAFGYMGAEEFEGEFCVVASGGGFGDQSFALGEEAGKQDSGFDLGAGHGHFVMNALQMAAANFERWEIAFASLNFRTHLKERGDDTLHGTFLEGGIAGNSCGEVLAGKDSGEKTDGGAGIFGVESTPTAFQAAKAAAGDVDSGAFDLYIRAEGFHAAECAVAIAGSGEMAEFAGAIGQGGEHGVTVGDGFVSGKLECAGEGAGGIDGNVFQEDGSLGEFNTRGFGGCEVGQTRRERRGKLNAEAQSSQRKKEAEGNACTGGQFYWGTLGKMGGNIWREPSVLLNRTNCAPRLKLERLCLPAVRYCSW